MTGIPEDVMGEAWNCWRTMGFVNDRLGMTPILAEALLAAEKRGEQREREKTEDLEDQLARIKQWCEAYPIDIFPEPDLTKARALLEAGGITLDAVSAGAMRHVVTHLAKMIGATAIRNGDPR